MRLGVVGLGKLGLPLACLLSRHYEVWGYDINQGLRQSLSNGTFTSWEPGVDYQSYKKVRIAKDIEELVANVDMVFLAVNTPNKEDGTMDLGSFDDAMGSIASFRIMNNYQGPEDDPFPVVVVSTVMPGTCQPYNKNYRGLLVISNPVWIALGSVINDLRSPPGMVIGCDCGFTGSACPHNQLLAVWLKVIINSKSISCHFTDTKTAEFIKLAHNAWCCIKMSWLGNLGDHSKELGVDIKALSRFMANGGERPGKFWLYGPPFGGPCFPRDLEFWLQATAPHANTVDDMAWTASEDNKERVDKICNIITSKSNVVILGRSYKHGVPVEEGSLGMKLTEALSHRCVVYCLDSWAKPPPNTAIPEDGDVDVWVVCHKELASQIPSNTKAKVINLWEVLA